MPGDLFLRQAELSPVRLQSKQGSRRAKAALSLRGKRRKGGGGGRRKRERKGKGGRRGGGRGWRRKRRGKGKTV